MWRSPLSNFCFQDIMEGYLLIPDLDQAQKCYVLVDLCLAGWQWHCYCCCMLHSEVSILPLLVKLVEDPIEGDKLMLSLCICFRLDRILECIRKWKRMREKEDETEGWKRRKRRKGRRKRKQGGGVNKVGWEKRRKGKKRIIIIKMKRRLLPETLGPKGAYMLW